MASDGEGARTPFTTMVGRLDRERLAELQITRAQRTGVDLPLGALVREAIHLLWQRDCVRGDGE